MSNEQGEALFCAKDVAEALGYKLARKAVQDHVDKGDVLKWNTPTTSGNQLMTYINESGLYALILSSKLESARRFKHWVTSEALPSIRKGVGRMVSWSVYFSRPHLNGKFIYIIIFILYIDKSFILPF